MTSRGEPVLVACIGRDVGEAVRQSLGQGFEPVHVSDDPDRGAADFDSVRPGVLVLALPAIRDAERYYLGLFRRSTSIGAKPHRTILLCNKNEVAQAYDECLRGRFDDYVLYWPVAFDHPRLAMSVHLAIRSLETARNDASDRRIAQIARQLDDLAPQVDRALAQNSDELRRADESLNSLTSGLVAAVRDASSSFADRLSRLSRGPAVTAEVKRHLQALNDQHLRPHLAATTSLLEPARESLAQLSNVYRSGLDSARRLANEARAGIPSILIVEDERTQREVYRHLLGSQRYSVSFAATAAEAFRLAIRSVPDLIVMDIELPDANGLDLTRELKQQPLLAEVPVLMITGHRERNVVVQSREAGAVDFLIKPFTPRSFMQKLERHLRPPQSQAS